MDIANAVDMCAPILHEIGKLSHEAEQDFNDQLASSIGRQGVSLVGRLSSRILSRTRKSDELADTRSALAEAAGSDPEIATIVNDLAQLLEHSRQVSAGNVFFGDTRIRGDVVGGNKYVGALGDDDG
jgi:hypothetical protein